MFLYGVRLSEEERVAKNVVNLINIRKNEVCLDRSLGISCDYIDKSIQELNSEVVTEMVDLINQREPRATVEIDDIIEINAYADENIKVVLSHV